MATEHTALPWERQTKESVVAFEAFAEYRDMGAERSHAKVAKKVGKNKGLIARWSRIHGWTARIEAWTDEQDRITREELLKGITAMRKNHAEIANQMLVKALKALLGLPTEEMTMQDIARAVDVATKLERLSRGEATERTESKTEIAGGVTVNDGVDLDKLTDDELATLNELLNKSGSA
jgi:hypothetical protein